MNMSRTLPLAKNNKTRFTYVLFSWTGTFGLTPPVRGGSVDIRVTAAQYSRLAKLLQANGIVFTILIPELQRLLDYENPRSRSWSIGFDYGRYNRLSSVRDE